MSPYLVSRCPVNKLSIMLSLIVLLFSMIHNPQSAMAAFSTYINVNANDNYEPKETFSEIIEDELIASASVGFGPRLGYYGYQMSASASASLNMWTGEIGFYSDSMGRYASSVADVRIEDTIYPVWDTGYSGAMDIQITWTISGDYTVYYWSDTENKWLVGGSPFNLALSSRFYYSVDGDSEWSPYSQFNLTDGYETWTRTISFDPAISTSITIGETAYGWLATYNSQYAVADFSNTGLIELVLPEGASYTSDSGVFLTIPEPSSLILLALGGLALRKNKGKFQD